MRCDHEKEKNHFFHSNVVSYVLVKREMSNQNRVQLRCTKQLDDEGTMREGILSFISPIDAYVEALASNEYLNEWEVQPFHQVDPREFIVTHDYKLVIFMTYAMAGSNGRLVGRKFGNKECPHKFLQFFWFDIPKDAVKKECFTVVYKNVDFINETFDRSGIHNYYGTLLDVGEWSQSEQIHTAQEALELSIISADEQHINQYALFDPLDRKWAFVDFKQSFMN